MKNYNELASLPVAKEAEDAIIASILADPDALDIAAEAGAIKEVFSVPANAELFGLLCDEKAAGNPIDLISIQAKVLDPSTRHHLISILGNSVTSDRVRHYVLVLRELQLRRRIILKCSEAIRNAGDTSFVFDDIVGSLSNEINTIIDTKATSPIVTGRSVVAQTIPILQNIQFGDGPSGIKSGLPSLDRITFGWQNSDLIIAAARPSVGKTSLALSFASYAVSEGIKVAFFSLEMSNSQIGLRLITSHTGISGCDLRGETMLTDYQWASINNLQAPDSDLSRLYLDDTPGISLAEFQAKARKLVTRYSVGLIVVDYLQLMTATGKHHATREQEVAEISRTLKATAKRLQVPVIALAQLARATDKDGKEPRLCDLRESGAIEQDADLVILMYRERDNPGDRMRILDVAKNRNGATGKVTVEFDPSTTSFREHMQDYSAPPKYNTF